MGAALSAAAAPAIPMDPEVKTGTLPNGLTYYIRHNASPQGQADFFIAQKVGSINEEVFGVVRATIEEMTTNGPTSEELGKVKAYLAKNIIENRTDNGYWETVIKVYDQYGPDMDSDYTALLDRMTPESIRDFGSRYICNADRVEISMKPE